MSQITFSLIYTMAEKRRVLSPLDKCICCRSDHYAHADPREKHYPNLPVPTSLFYGKQSWGRQAFHIREYDGNAPSHLVRLLIEELILFHGKESCHIIYNLSSAVLPSLIVSVHFRNREWILQHMFLMA
jgi:hypothetical protein